MKNVDTKEVELIRCSECKADIGWARRPSKRLFEQLGDGGDPYSLEEFLCTSCLKSIRADDMRKRADKKGIERLFDAVRKELRSSSEKYRDHFVSSKEALGAITEEYEEVKECLRELKLTDGIIYNSDFPELSNRLEMEGIQLAAMAVKMIYSCCGVAHDGEKASLPDKPTPPPLRTSKDTLSGLFS